MKDFVLIFISIYVLLTTSTKFTKNIDWNFRNVLILWGKIFFVSSLFIVPAYIILNFDEGFEKLMNNCIRFCNALIFVSFLSIPVAIVLNKFAPSIKKLN